MLPLLPKSRQAWPLLVWLWLRACLPAAGGGFVWLGRPAPHVTYLFP